MTSLRCNPMSLRPSPAYPTKLDALAAPSLLKNHVPPAWLARREMVGVLGAFLAAGAGGCRTETPAVGQNGGDGQLTRLASGGAAIVAPVFEHGDGRGRSRWAMACSAVASPVYLPEEEAVLLIAEELRKAGLSISEQSAALNEVIIVGHQWKTGYEWVSDQRGDEYIEIRGPLAADLVESGRSIVIEYVSWDDFDRLGGDDRNGRQMEIKAVADSVAAEVARQGRGIYFGAFYDPVEYLDYGDVKLDFDGLDQLGDEKQWQEFQRRSDEAFNSARAAVRAKARELLRAQVHDFVAWLKGQGVI